MRGFRSAYSSPVADFNAFQTFVDQATQNMPPPEKKAYYDAAIKYLQKQLEAIPVATTLTENRTPCPNLNGNPHVWKTTGQGTIRGPVCFYCEAPRYPSTTRRVGNRFPRCPLPSTRWPRPRGFPCADGKDPASVAAHVHARRGRGGLLPRAGELRVAEKATRDERAEQADAQRVLSGLLCESMQRHGVACVELPADGGATRYARLSAARGRVVLHDEDAVLALVRDATAAIAACPRGGRVAAVVRLARDRLLAQAPPPGRPRVTVVTTRPRATAAAAPAPAAAAPAPAAAAPVPLARAPAETQRLLAQFVANRDEQRTARARLQPLREERRRSERELRAALETPTTAPLTVRVRRGEAGPERVMQIVAPPPRASARAAPSRRRAAPRGRWARARRCSSCARRRRRPRRRWRPTRRRPRRPTRASWTAWWRTCARGSTSTAVVRRAAAAARAPPGGGAGGLVVTERTRERGRWVAGTPRANFFSRPHRSKRDGVPRLALPLSSR